MATIFIVKHLIFKLIFKIHNSLEPYRTAKSSPNLRFSHQIFFIYTNIKDKVIAIKTHPPYFFARIDILQQIHT